MLLLQLALTRFLIYVKSSAIFYIACSFIFNACNSATERTVTPANSTTKTTIKSQSDDNSYNPNRAALGQRMFNDVRLSSDNTVACASCHNVNYAFSDTSASSIGIRGQKSLRNSPPLFNLVDHEFFFWDGGSPTLELQISSPIESEEEMDMNLLELCAKLNKIDTYREQALEIFGTEVTPFVITRSIANYLRTLESRNSPYDRFIDGDESALDHISKQGLELFNGKARCYLCHNGPNLMDNKYHNLGLPMENLDSGRARITMLTEDFGKFKTPTLRNLILTAPYMHDGRLTTLEDVIDHISKGGHDVRNKDSLLVPTDLDENEKGAIVHFLKHSLLDSSFINNQ